MTSKRQKTKELTRQRRKTLSCKVYETKLDKSKLSKHTLNHLDRLFLEGKWLYNHILSTDNFSEYDTKTREVPVKVKNIFETRQLNTISAQMKQGIKDRVFHNLISISSLKKNSRKTGKLKFVSQLNSIPLKQHGYAYRIIKSSSRIKIQCLKKHVKVYGLEQLPEDCEIANANLIRKAGDYYIHITTYQKKEKKVIPDRSIGIDFGCETQLTLSNRIKIKYEVFIPKRLKRLDRKIMKHNRKRSNNKYKDQLKRQKEYLRLTNIKKDIRNKIVSVLTKNYRKVIFQDESIHAWQSGLHGKKIYNTGIGGIIEDLKNKSHTPITVNRFFPSTQLCPKCGKKNKLSQSERTYHCDCGYKEDRDIKAAQCIETEGLKNNIPVEHRNFKTGETGTSVLALFDSLESKYVKVSFCRRARKPHIETRYEVAHQ